MHDQRNQDGAQVRSVLFGTIGTESKGRARLGPEELQRRQAPQRWVRCGVVVCDDDVQQLLECAQIEVVLTPGDFADPSLAFTVGLGRFEAARKLVPILDLASRLWGRRIDKRCVALIGLVDRSDSCDHPTTVGLQVTKSADDKRALSRVGRVSAASPEQRPPDAGLHFLACI